MGKIHIRYGIAFTYRCNLDCQWCNRFLDKDEVRFKTHESDLTMDQLKEGHRRVIETGIYVEKARITGGEPQLNPDFVPLAEYVSDVWNQNYDGRTCVFSNGTQKNPLRKTPGKQWRFNIDQDFKGMFQPPMISPLDHGLTPKAGIYEECRRQGGCGRLFDAYGFSFCIYAGVIGRLLRKDPYQARPVTYGTPDICGHCPFSVGINQTHALFHGAADGDIDPISPTYKRALEQARNEGPFPLKRFEERVDDENSNKVLVRLPQYLPRQKRDWSKWPEDHVSRPKPVVQKTGMEVAAVG